MSKRRVRKPMSQETKDKIAAAVRRRAQEKRKEQGLPPQDDNGINQRTKPAVTVKMNDQKFSDDLFIPMKTNNSIDELFSNKGGVPKACNYILIGDPGVGKTTVGMDILADLHKEGFKCVFISAEMTRIDLHEYCERYPKFGDLDILFLGEYLDDNPKLVIEEIIDAGYDAILIDSFVEVQEAVKEANRMSTGASEKWLIDLMIKHNLGNNQSKKNTTFLCIQQVTKGGVFVGSNKLKHNTTGMMEIRFDDTINGGTYIEFSKNRRGPVNKKMYFNLKKGGNIEYDFKRFELDSSTQEVLETELNKIKADDDAFDSLFRSGDLTMAIVEDDMLKKRVV